MIFALDCFAQNEIEGLQDIQPPVDFPPNYFLLFLLLAIALIVGAFFIIRFLRKRMKAQKKIVLPAKPSYLIAYEALEELKRLNLPAAGKIKEYYTVLSDIVRRYLESQFDIHAPEMTTEEFLHTLHLSPSLVARHKELLFHFLNLCDLVKFAKYGPSLSEMEEGFTAAKKLIDETKQTEGIILKK
ncbi:MAG: hypothetical protein P9M07_04360 [Candidatus Aceula meridiana]|nr:hypothetical protein [Candidatus Aceula meridiana]